MFFVRFYPYMQIWESDIFIEIMIGPLKSYGFAIRVWMIDICFYVIEEKSEPSSQFSWKTSYH